MPKMWLVKCISRDTNGADSGAGGFPHLPLHFLSGRGGFRVDYFLFYFLLPLITPFEADRSGSEFLTDWRKKGSPVFRSGYLTGRNEFETNYIFLYFLLLLTTPFEVDRSESSTNPDPFTFQFLFANNLTDKIARGPTGPPRNIFPCDVTLSTPFLLFFFSDFFFFKSKRSAWSARWHELDPNMHMACSCITAYMHAWSSHETGHGRQKRQRGARDYAAVCSAVRHVDARGSQLCWGTIKKVGAVSLVQNV